MSLWTVYKHPQDFPENFVARRFEIERTVNPTGECLIAEELGELRTVLEGWGLVRVPRDVSDDPAIVEVWL